MSVARPAHTQTAANEQISIHESEIRIQEEHLRKSLKVRLEPVVNERTVGSVVNLAGATVLGESKNASGQTVRRIRDTGGAVIEMTLDAAGNLIDARVVSQAMRQLQPLQPMQPQQPPR